MVYGEVVLERSHEIMLKTVQEDHGPHGLFRERELIGAMVLLRASHERREDGEGYEAFLQMLLRVYRYWHGEGMAERLRYLVMHPDAEWVH